MPTIRSNGAGSFGSERVSSVWPLNPFASTKFNPASSLSPNERITRAFSVFSALAIKPSPKGFRPTYSNSADALNEAGKRIDVAEKSQIKRGAPPAAVRGLWSRWNLLWQTLPAMSRTKNGDGRKS